MDKDIKKIIFPLIAVLVGVVLVYFVVYNNGKNKKDNEINFVKTYKNEKYKFSFEYPNTVELSFNNLDNEKLDVSIIDENLDTYLVESLLNNFKFNRKLNGWEGVAFKGNPPENPGIAPDGPKYFKTKNNLDAYVYSYGDECWSKENGIMESPDKKFIIKLSSYDDSECNETNGKIDSIKNTIDIKKVFDTLVFN